MKILPKKKRKLSKNRRAEIILGKRNLPPGSIPFDQPCELGYHCPVCKYEHFRVNQMTWDERLHWSEYEGFIWCSVCNKDYPSCVCYNAQSNIPDYVYRVNPDCKTYADLSIKVFLDTIEEAINRKEKQREKVEKPIKRKNKTYGARDECRRVPPSGKCPCPPLPSLRRIRPIVSTT